MSGNEDTAAIDWTQPLEAVHEDGRVVPMWLSSENDLGNSNPDRSGDYYTYSDAHGEDQWIWRPDGTPWLPRRERVQGWRIRNRLQAPHKPAERDWGAEGGEDTPSDGNALKAAQEAVQEWNAANPTAEPFVFWPGGDEAPGDWDGGDVLRIGGKMEYPALYVSPYEDNQRWFTLEHGGRHGSNFCDIIGYRRRVEAPAKTQEAPHLATYDPATHVVVERMTKEEAANLFSRYYVGDLADGLRSGSEDAVVMFRDLGLIKPEPTPLDKLMEAHPDADRRTAELCWGAWMGEG